MYQKFLFLGSAAVLFLLNIPIAYAQILQCNFVQTGANYDCIINGAIIPNDENVNFAFTGNHLADRTDASVTRLYFFSSVKPFIIRQAFTSFPSLTLYNCENSVGQNIKRFQANAFQNAGNLETIIVRNSGLTQVEATSLRGAPNIRTLTLNNNRLTSIPVGFLESLANLNAINLANNMLTSIHQDFFKIPTLLTSINLNNNQLTSLPGQLLSTNSRLVTFSAQNNQVNSIGPIFLNNLPQLNALSLVGNECISQNWMNIAGSQDTISNINAALATCHANYGQVSQELQCNFVQTGNNYDCIINGAVIEDNENSTFIFTGTHLSGRNDTSVTRLYFFTSLVPFIIKQAFTSFPRLTVYSSANAVTENIKRLQANAFENAENLETIIATNSGLTQVEATSLRGASNVRTLNLNNNRLTSIPVWFLDSLENLNMINLANNMLTLIHQDFFKIPTLLTSINLNSNQLTSLPGRLLSTNSRLVTFSAQNNQINSIGPNFLDNSPQLNALSLVGNECISQNWMNIAGSQDTIRNINAALATCHANYDRNVVGTRTFNMKLRGRLTLYRKDGDKVGEL